MLGLYPFRLLGVLAAVFAAAAVAEIPGDADLDGDVDADDFALFALCQAGPETPSISACETPFDFNVDADVDLADLAALQRCFSGANQPGAADCAPHSARIEDGCLLIFGTAADSALALRLRAGDPAVLEVDVDDDGVVEFSFAREQFDRIQIDARGGDDFVRIDDQHGAFTDVVATTIFGGPGADTIHGGGGGEVIVGGPGEDVLFLGGGGDRSIWNPGDGTDLVEGGPGVDVVEVNGGSGDETFTVTANGTRVRFDRLSAGAFSLDIGTCESLVLFGHDGDDTLSCTGNLAALIQISADGGPGDDTLLGSNGADVLIGGDDNDLIDGNQGADVALLGAGDDVFNWDPGDGNDIVEGQDGADLLRFNGSNGSEIFEFTANGGRLRFTRNLGNIVMDVDGVEQVDLNALGGVDVATVNHLAGTALTDVRIGLAASGGGGDAQIDDVIIHATPAADELRVVNSLGGVLVLGQQPSVVISGQESTFDRLTLSGLGGDDELDARALPANVIGLILSGGSGDDVLYGSAGGDTLRGEDDDDVITGGDGGDVIHLGPGNDRAIWNPGDDTDLIEGDAGVDTVEVNGGDSDEDFTITANGTRVRFDRLAPAPFALDIGACENLLLKAHGGDDTLACTGNLAALIQITADGGAGDDTLLGSNGVDLLIGGDDHDFLDGNQGNDVLLCGAGDDLVRWDPGDGSDTLEGQDGMDQIQFNGSNGSEIFTFSPNGGRVRFTRNLGNIVLDFHGVEAFDLRALGAADQAIIHDLAGTEVVEIFVSLSASGGVGDAAADQVVVNGSASDDAIELSAIAGMVRVGGLAAEVFVSGAEPANDLLTVNGLGGNDAVTTGAGVTSLIMLSVNP